jgi:hypothetical protein
MALILGRLHFDVVGHVSEQYSWQSEQVRVEIFCLQCNL